LLNVIAGLHGGGAGGAGGTSYESIQTSNVGSGGSSSITFSSIPSTYKHLQIRAISRDNGAGVYNTYKVTYNGDTASNYSVHAMYGQNINTVDQFGNANQTGIIVYATPGAIASSIFGAQVIDILDYADTNKYKTQRSIGGVSENNDNNLITVMSGSWRSTTAISSITITCNGASFQQYSHFALYGIKG
jgi:hypothetical protein